LHLVEKVLVYNRRVTIAPVDEVRIIHILAWYDIAVHTKMVVPCTGLTPIAVDADVGYVGKDVSYIREYPMLAPRCRDALAVQPAGQ
jgi:hypothetical protein